jgi:hypothetical protein
MRHSKGSRHHKFFKEIELQKILEINGGYYTSYLTLNLIIYIAIIRICREICYS